MAVLGRGVLGVVVVVVVLVVVVVVVVVVVGAGISRSKKPENYTSLLFPQLLKGRSRKWMIEQNKENRGLFYGLVFNLKTSRIT